MLGGKINSQRQKGAMNNQSRKINICNKDAIDNEGIIIIIIIRGIKASDTQ